MSFKIKSLEEIENLSDEEIVNYIIKSSEECQTFEVRHFKLDEDLRFKSTLTIDDVKHGFDFNHKDCVYTFPKLDEREMNIYRKELHGGIKIPPKGFYWDIKAHLNIMPLGLVECTFRIDKIKRNSSDWRFTKQGKPEFVEVKRFYYDYEEKKYIQVFDDAAIHNKKKSDGKNKESVKHYLEYENRLECLHEIYRRLAIIEEEYSLKLDKVRKRLKRISSNRTGKHLKSYINEFLNFNNYLLSFRSPKSCLNA